MPTDDDRKFWSIALGVELDNVVSVKQADGQITVTIAAKSEPTVDIFSAESMPDTIMGYPVVYVEM